MTQGKKVALGMSGGVDSSLCAHLLIEQGYDVTGVFLECWQAPGCRTNQDRKDALKIALDLHIPFKVLDFKKEYHAKVVEYFFAEYQAGRTPNPDVVCNKEIKFGLFYNWTITHGFDKIATGHYANSNDKGELTTAKDSQKDQTYFLYQLNKNQIKRILFPLSKLTKAEVRKKAGQLNLHVAHKPDSVGICFIGDINVKKFLKDQLGEKIGEVVDTQSNVIGSHQGIWFYTIGQRHGFTIHPHTLIKQSDNSVIQRTNLPPFYVIDKNVNKNQIMVGFDNDAYKNQFNIKNVSSIDKTNKFPAQCLVRIRHTGKMLSANLKKNTVTLHEPTKGIASGQSAVFYQKINHNSFKCLGGGVIEQIFHFNSLQ